MERFSLRQSGLYAPANTVLRASGWGQLRAGDITPGTATLLKIAEASGTGSSGILSFTGIPGTYRSLQVHLVGRTTNATGFVSGLLTFEASPTAGAYGHQRLVATAGTVTGQENVLSTASIFAGAFPGASTASTVHASSIITLPEYANTSVTKAVHIQSLGINTFATGGIAVDLVAGIFASAAAISQIYLTTGASNWTTTTRATLYGIPA